MKNTNAKKHFFIVIVLVIFVIIVAGGNLLAGSFTMPFQGSLETTQGSLDSLIPILGTSTVIMAVLLFLVIYLILRWFT